MIDALIDTIDAAYDTRRHRDLLEALWRQERWFDTPRQRRAAEIARDALADAGVAETRLEPYAADGRTRWQDWTTHLAWDCPAAKLTLGDDVLADRGDCPQSVVFWSGPLERTTAPVVDADALETIGPDHVAGRFVLTARQPREMKQLVKDFAPAAIVSDYIGKTPAADEHTTKWCNTWADGPGGWYFRASDAVLPGFCLSPAKGQLLRRRLAAEPGLRLTGFCDSRLYEGAGQCTTGLVGGRDASREVWLFGHACEQGAHDNCSGVSVYVLAACLLAELIDAGRLPRPRLGIRVITTEECLGMLAFATEHPGLLGRAIVGMNVDGVGAASEADHPFRVHYGPLSSPTIGWAAAGAIGELLARRHAGEYHLAAKCTPPQSDDMIADPNCGVPTWWLGTNGDVPGYHASGDTPAVCSDLSLRCNLLLTAAWAYLCADLNEQSLAEILPAARAWIDANVLPAEADDAKRLRRWAAGRAIRDAARWGLPAAAYEPAAAAYCPPTAAPLDGLPTAGPTYVRRTWGTCTLETLPADRTRGLSRWSNWQNAALCWTHNRRPFAAVERLTKAEAGTLPEGGLRPLMDALLEAGLAYRTDAE